MPRPLPLLETDSLQPHDYELYHKRLLSLLELSPRTRFAALKHGGIVWRLVVQYVTDVRKLISDMPRAAPFEALGGLAVSSLPPRYDDGLSDVEEDAICGVYDMTTAGGEILCILTVTILI